MAYGMMGPQFMAWIGSEFGSSNLRTTQWLAYECASVIDLARARCAPSPLRDCGDWPSLGWHLLPLLGLSHAKIEAAMVEAQRPSRGPFSASKHAAARGCL
ncbi:hypothetical protein ABIB90_008381 [Bradyrhizobium sp. JR4.1]